MTHSLRVLPVLLALAAPTLCAHAQATRTPGPALGNPPQAAVRATGVKASPQERGELTRRFVTKWGGYVQRVYGVSTGVWAKRMAPNFAMVDGDNFRRAIERDTFEGAMSELSGDGTRFSDAQIQARGSANGEKTLGALGNDLVFTPLQPCRIVDTRNTAAGAIAANSSRSFLAINASNFSGQGGSATNCGTLGLNATAVAINFTAVPLSGGGGAGGHATVYPYGTTQPNTASVNYPGNIPINNSLIAQIPNPLGSFDFTVYTTSQSQYVVDIVGYFAPPVATALQCVDTLTTIVSVPAGGQQNAVAPVCPAGHTQTATNCESQTWQMPFVYFKNGTCSAQNNSGGAAELRASRTCCRVPGR